MNRSTILKFVLLAVMLLLLISACGDDVPPGCEENELVGTWNAVTKTYYWGSISNPDSTDVFTYTPGIDTLTWTFESPDSLLQCFYTSAIPFCGHPATDFFSTWSISDGELTITTTRFTVNTVVYQCEIEGNILTLTNKLDPAKGMGDWGVLVFLRI